MAAFVTMASLLASFSPSRLIPRARGWKIAQFTKHTLRNHRVIIFKCQYAATGLGACNEVALWRQLSVSLSSVVKSQAVESPW